MKPSPLFLSFCLSVILSVSGCSTTSSLGDRNRPEPFESKMEVQQDELVHATIVNGPIITETISGGYRPFYRLEGTIKEDGLPSVQIVLSEQPSVIDGFFVFQSATSGEGEALELVQIQRKVKNRGGDAFWSLSEGLLERVGVIVPLDYLIEKKESGLIVKVDGVRMDISLFIPPAYVSGFLDKFENYL